MKMVIFRDLINVIYFKKMTTKTLDLSAMTPFHTYCEKQRMRSRLMRVL